MNTYEILLTGTSLKTGDEIYLSLTDSWAPIHPDTPFAVNGIFRRLKPVAVECDPVTPAVITPDPVTPEGMKLCDFTGEHHPEDEFTEYAGFGRVWDGAELKFRDQYAECSVTHDWFRKSIMLTTHTGDLICEDEYASNWFTCAETSDVHHEDDRCSVFNNSGNERFVCTTARESNYRMCAYYDAYYPSEVGHVVGGTYCGGDAWISGRARRCGPFFRCESCDEVFHDDDYGDDGRCSGCGESSDSDDDDADTTIIQSYDSTAYPPRIGDPKERYYGVENEVELKSDAPCGNSDMASRVIRVIGKDFAIIKGDGSLHNGFEIVTAPATLKIHAERWRLLCTPGTGDARVGLASARTETCGLHVHVSRTDFKSPLQLSKVQVFVNEPSHRGFIEGIARRGETSWCKLYKKNLGMRDHYNTEKYVSVNCLHSKTVEFRIFKGTLTYAHFMSSLQFVDALMDYTLPGSTGFSDLTVGKFCEFVKNNRRHWPHLTNELVRLGFLSKEAKVKVELKAADGSTIPGTEELLPDAPTKSRVTPALVYSGHLAPEGSAGLLGHSTRTSVPGWFTGEARRPATSRPPLPIWSAVAPSLFSESPYAGRGYNNDPITQEELSTMIRLHPEDIRRSGDWIIRTDIPSRNGFWAADTIGRAVGDRTILRYSYMLDGLRVNPSFSPFADRQANDAGPTEEERQFMRPLVDNELIQLGDYLVGACQWAWGVVGSPSSREGNVLRFDPALVWARAAVPQGVPAAVPQGNSAAVSQGVPAAVPRAPWATPASTNTEAGVAAHESRESLESLLSPAELNDGLAFSA